MNKTNKQIKMKKLFTLFSLGFFASSVMAQDTTDCLLNVNFTYSIDGETIYFTNTSLEEPLDANYDWWIPPFSSVEEDPSFLISDLEDPTLACLTVNNDDWSCYDTLCMTISFVEDSAVVEDSTDCALVVSFSKLASETILYCTNTSTGEPADASYRWYIDGLLSSSDENPSFDLALFDESTWLCLEIMDSIGLCYDSTCTQINLDSVAFDSTANIRTTEIGEFKVYPNPATSEINIAFEDTNEGKEIYIHNAFGELVLFEKIDKSSSSILISIVDLPSGYYSVTVIDSSKSLGAMHQKFVKYK